MRVAVLGSTGLLGLEICNFLREQRIDFVGFDRTIFKDAEANPGHLTEKLSLFTHIYNCAAYTNVDEAEENRDEAIWVNCELPRRLAEVAKINDARLMHVSTDYVFNGIAEVPYSLGESPSPINFYGLSKLLGEQAVHSSGSDYCIIRTSWLYGEHGDCFPKKIAQTLTNYGSLRVVADQVGSPTWTRDLAELIFNYSIIEKMPRLVHGTASGRASWFDFAVEVGKSLGLTEGSILQARTSDLLQKAKRPSYSVLDNSEGEIDPIGDWRERWEIAASRVLLENT